VAVNVESLIRGTGIERVGFLTLTFADDVQEMAEAQRRFRSLRTNVLDGRYGSSICAVERQRSGRIHFHLLVGLRFDARTGFDWSEARRGIYRSACPLLRAEWAFWRRTAPLYGFGRTELLPIRSTAGAVGCYLGGYIAKHVGRRRIEDKGSRLIRYNVDARAATVRFSWNSKGMRLWRHKLAEFARLHQVADLSEMSSRFGPRWAYHLREQILGAFGPGEWVWDEFEKLFRHVGD
jgi:hypothetical protein